MSIYALVKDGPGKRNVNGKEDGSQKSEFRIRKHSGFHLLTSGFFSGYNPVMVKREIGVEVFVDDHFWHEDEGRYVYSFHCPACKQVRLVAEPGIHRCDCGSWLIVRQHP